MGCRLTKKENTVKYLKVLGLAAVAAMAVMAFGASTAAATQVCVAATAGHPADGKCAAGERELTNGESVTGTSSNPVLTSSVTTVTCKESSTTVKANTGTGTPIAGEVTALSFANDCTTSSGTSCTVTVVNLPYTGSLETNKLTVTDAVGAGAKVVCGVLINCTFTTKKAELTVTHNASTTFDATVSLEREGGFCPATAEWHATYHSATNTTVL
jgi:hypothetical protein